MRSLHGLRTKILISIFSISQASFASSARQACVDILQSSKQISKEQIDRSFGDAFVQLVEDQIFAYHPISISQLFKMLRRSSFFEDSPSQFQIQLVEALQKLQSAAWRKPLTAKQVQYIKYAIVHALNR